LSDTRLAVGQELLGNELADYAKPYFVRGASMAAAAKIVDDGASVLTLALVDYYNLTQPLDVILFKNNITVDFNTTMGDLTEADFDGYAPITIDDWAIGSLVGEAYAMDGTSVRQWTISGVTNLPQTIYGYGLVYSGLLEYAESLASPIALTAVGQIVQIQPRILVGNCP
jgi:hypothetical protein